MCLLLGRVDNARLHAGGAVHVASFWHRSESIGLLEASIVVILKGRK